MSETSPAVSPSLVTEPTITTAQPQMPTRPRLWPGVVLVVLEWLILTVPGWVAPLTAAHFYSWFIGPMAVTLALIIWWLAASRLSWKDRLLGVLALVVSCAAITFLSDPTVGAMGMIVYALPILTTVWVLSLVATPFLSWPGRRAVMIVAFLLVVAGFLSVTDEGVTGSMTSSWHLRWAMTEEDRALADIRAHKFSSETKPDAATLTLQPGDWPAFRGPHRDSRLTGVRIAADWNEHPPRQLWRHRVGPGWSSFAVAKGRLYTQEQRGPDEVVVCYDAGTGTELWAHADKARFSETLGGPGPRATPTFHEGRLYVQGATGLFNCLDAATGKELWKHDLRAEAGADLPMWGFAGSPLVDGRLVIVFAGGPDGKSVLAYDAVSGKLAWSKGQGKMSYSSPHLATLGGIDQVLMMTEQGLASYAPETGDLLWQHDWPSPQMVRILQPTVIDEANVLIGTGGGMGTRHIRIKHEGKTWGTEEVRTIRTFKPYFNDLVLYNGHIYGFDGYFFSCVNLADGKTLWRDRRYGSGQVQLLADEGVLLVLSEQGEAALVQATPDGHRQLCRFQALDGKTWNHPVVAHGKLFVRNSREAACYELTEKPAQAETRH